VNFDVLAAPFALNFDGLVGLRLKLLEPISSASGNEITGNSWHFSGVLYGR